MNRYAPGPWFAVVTDTALALLPADVAPEIVERLWATLQAREGFGAALDALTGDFGTDLALVPSFAIVVVDKVDAAHPERAAEARIAVRGPLSVNIEGDAELGHLRVSGARVTTWSESVSTNPASIELVTDAAADAGPLLPIETGVVRCAWLLMTLRETEPAAADPAETEDDDRDGDGDEDGDEDGDGADDGPAPVSLVPGSASAAARAALVPGGRVVPVPVLAPVLARVPDLVAVPASAPRPVSARSHTNAGPVAASAAVADFDDDHDGETISVEQLIGLGDGTPAPIVPSRPTLTPVLAGVLLLSSGGEVLLDRGAIIGRKPSAGKFMAGAMPHLVTVPSPQQDISRSHVEVRCEGITVFAVDLGTTNGTRLLRVGQAAARLSPQEPTILVHGDVLDLGDEVRVTFVEAL